MKCFKGWTIGLAATALLAAPGAILAQQTPPSTPPSPSRPAGAEGQPAAALEHLTKAKTALADIPETSLTGSARMQIVVLQRRIAALEQTASKEPAPIKASWSSDVAAIDRTLTEMLGGPSAPPASQPTGTTGSAAPSAAKTAEGSLDETARTKLQEVRAHVTAFAAAMGAMSGAPSSPSAPLSTAAAAAAAEPSPAAAAPASPPAAAPASPPAAAPTPSEPAQQPAQPPAASPTTPQGEPTAPAKPEAAQTQVDADAVKRHLTAARDSLSQLTQLPAATQLTGDARTQVSQLITNFNELITTNNEWRASYAKVQSNLNALIGDQRTDEAPATPAAGTPGAVGTSGSIAIDPAIKAKLVEFRTHVLEFEKAAGGAGSAPSAPARQPEPSAAASSTTTPAGPAATETPAAASPAAAAAATTTASAAASSVTGATGSTAEAPRPAGTSGRTPAAEPEPQSRPSATPDQSSPDAASKQSGHAEAMRHLEAIEAILNGRASDAKSDSPAGTSGRATSATSLDRAQIEQIKQHLTELRRALAQSGGR